MKNKFLLELKARGYLNQCTDLDKLDDDECYEDGINFIKWNYIKFYSLHFF